METKNTNKILIYSKDVIFLKEISNIFNSNGQNKIFVSLTFENLETKLSKIKFNILIIDLCKEKKLDLYYFDRKNIDKIVFLYNKFSIIDEKVYNNRKFVFVEKEKEEINRLLQYKYKNDSLEIEKVKEQIEKLNFEKANLGVKYIIESVLLIKNNDNLYNLEKDIYPIIAKKYNVTTNRVKWNINSCINKMYKNNDVASINRYFGYGYNRRPTPKTIIFTILSRI